MNYALMSNKLERWFTQHRRDLPWRAPIDNANVRAYRTLVAEFMLQQTQVSRVIDRYEVFIARFPTIHALARASEQDVLGLWQGLGYYSRARNLLRCARAVVARHDGVIPEDPHELTRLPGIGRYTAGAIASIAFGTPAPVVDGNVARVLARVVLIEIPIASKEAQVVLWEAAEQLVQQAAAPGDLNQAVMELGSRVCTPSNPRCKDCPIARHCRAGAARRQNELPVPRAATRTEDVHVVSVILTGQGRQVFLRQRGDDAGLWAGLWEPPAIRVDGPVTPNARLWRTVRQSVRKEHGLEIGRLDARGIVTRKLSHRTVHFIVLTCSVVRGRARGGRWVSAAGPEQESLPPMSNAHRRILTAGLSAP